jgi:choline-sulfatase
MPKRPNILLLLSDQHNADVMGCAGDGLVATPHLDRLAAAGLRHDAAYCQNPVCSPSRASLISGRYSRSCGIYDNKHVLEANGMTLPRALGATGYRTCLIGKMHFNGEQFQGFQQRPYGDLFGQAHQPDPRRTPDKGFNGLGGVLDNSGPSALPLPLTQTEICVAETAKWLQQHVGLHGAQPFFLTVSLDKPHFPMNPPPEYYERYRGRVRVPPFPAGWLEETVPFVQTALRTNPVGEHYGCDPEVHERALTAYYGCLEWIDDAIGRILATLDYLGLAEDTIVVYSSDHGEMMGQKGLWQKTYFFDASARVPFLVRWPGRIEPGTTSDEPVGLIDLFPSFCAAAGATVPDECEGMDLTAHWTRREPVAREGIWSESVVLDHPDHAGCMLRTRGWKYNLYLDGHDELYDLIQDPEEWTNLATDPAQAGRRAAMRAEAEAWWRPEQQAERYRRTPMMQRQKDQYFYSNQFMGGDGTVFDGRP